MRIHEYQAKKILSEYSIPVPKGVVIEGEEEAEQASSILGFPLVVKAQIHAGGRGKAKGVRIVKQNEDLKSSIKDLLKKRLVTSQSEKEGKFVGKLLLESCEEVRKELYLAIMIDRNAESPRLIVSKRGGVEIEDLTKNVPSLVSSELIDVRYGLLPYQIRRLFFSLEIDLALLDSFWSLCERLYRVFVEKDCILCEINPLAIVENKGFVALDAKIVFDDNALFRHREILELNDPTQEDPREHEAKRSGLNYVKLKGSVGCVANGAGLAMATIDLVRTAGREPANFLDVGGGANREIVSQGLKIVHSDEDVKIIFINIFGGILRCDTFALGFRDVASSLNKPIIMRLSGTNAEEGLRLISDLDVPVILVRDLKDAVKKLKEIKA